MTNSCSEARGPIQISVRAILPLPCARRQVSFVVHAAALCSFLWLQESGCSNLVQQAWSRQSSNNIRKPKLGTLWNQGLVLCGDKRYRGPAVAAKHPVLILRWSAVPVPDLTKANYRRCECLQISGLTWHSSTAVAELLAGQGHGATPDPNPLVRRGSS